MMVAGSIVIALGFVWVFLRLLGVGQSLIPVAILGACRSLFNWTDLTGEDFIGAGTSLKFYVFEGNQANDITPIRSL